MIEFRRDKQIHDERGEWFQARWHFRSTHDVVSVNGTGFPTPLSEVRTAEDQPSLASSSIRPVRQLDNGLRAGPYRTRFGRGMLRNDGDCWRTPATQNARTY
jgi:hypothetical protein